MNRKPLIIAAVFVLVALGIGVAGAQLDRASAGATELNILISHKETMYEYTRAGTLLRVFAVPYGEPDRPGTEHLRDIAINETGDVVAFNGTFDPFLSTYDVSADAWSHATTADWSIPNNGKYGGIGTFKQYAFVADMTEPNPGIARFDIGDGSVLRTTYGTAFADLNVGLDGRVYGLATSTRDIFVYDPMSMGYIETIALSSSAYAIAVDASGEIFAASTFGGIYRFSADGALLEEQWRGEFALQDLDVAQDGRLVGSTTDGDVYVVDAGLTEYSSFTAGWDNTFVAFADPLDSPLPTVTPTPTPTNTMPPTDTPTVTNTPTVTPTHTPTPPFTPSEAGGAIEVAAGSEHDCLITLDDQVQCWGNNSSGKLGIGTNDNGPFPVPQDVPLPGTVDGIAAGMEHSCALLTKGEVRCSGAWMVTGTGQQSSWPAVPEGLGAGVVQLSASYQHTCAVTSAGDVSCWGDNAFGQVGPECESIICETPLFVSALDGTVASAAAGRLHTCVVTDERRMQCWGDNSAGQLGDGTTNSSTTPLDVIGLSGPVQSFAANIHTCALIAGGTVQCWGLNEFGQLGNGASGGINPVPVDVVGLDDPLAVDAGAFHTCAVTSAGGATCWGSNAFGQLGDGTFDDAAAPIDVAGLSRGVTAISAGEFHTCAVVSGGLKCWGEGYGPDPVDVVAAPPPTDAPTDTPTTTDTRTPTPGTPATSTPPLGPAMPTSTATPVPPVVTNTPSPTPTATPRPQPTATAVPTATPSPEPVASPPGSLPGLFGDLSCDGAVTAVDATLALQIDAGLVASLVCQDAGDVNGDGRVDSLDAALILQYVAGLIDGL